MLLDEFKLRDQIEPAGTSSLRKFLETSAIDDRTAIQLACLYKSCAIIELLFEAGSDLKALDDGGNTAIIIAASSPPIVEMGLITKELSPSIFKVSFRFKSIIIANFLKHLLYILRRSTKTRLTRT